ncbi:MAG: hypothetical protein K8I30_10135 [Anaerolineae bacterium]|nr:hypothetical protein [Anaerolineae bacterium]
MAGDDLPRGLGCLGKATDTAAQGRYLEENLVDRFNQKAIRDDNDQRDAGQEYPRDFLKFSNDAGGRREGRRRQDNRINRGSTL